MQQAKIRTTQMIIVVAITVGGTIVLSIPRFMAMDAQNSGWIALLVGAAVGFVGGYLYVSLARRFPDKTFCEYAPIVFGSVIGKVFGLSFTVYAMASAAVFVRIFSNSVIIPLVPETPISFISTTLMILLVYECYSGLQSISQLSQVFVLPMLVAIAAIVVGVVPMMQVGYLRPLFQPGLIPIGRAALRSATFFGESIVVLMFYPYLTRKRDALRSIWLGYLLATMALLPVVVAGIAVYGEDVADLFFPTLSLSRLINFGGVVEHLEGLFVILWLFSAFLKVSIVFYVAAESLAQTLNLDDYRPIVAILGLVVAFLAMIPNDIIVLSSLYLLHANYGWAYEYGMPALTLLVAMVSHRRGGSHEQAGVSVGR